jgi:hypothetical protein
MFKTLILAAGIVMASMGLTYANDIGGPEPVYPDHPFGPVITDPPVCDPIIDHGFRGCWPELSYRFNFGASVDDTYMKSTGRGGSPDRK